MTWLRRLNIRPAWIVAFSVGGLLIALMIAGIAAFLINRDVHDVADQALTYDVQLEDRGDDLRVAVLDLRHYHRNIVFAGPSRGGIASFEIAYQQLQHEIDQLEELGIADEQVPQPAQLRETAKRYYANFRPAIELYETDQQAFTITSDDGLLRLAQLERETQVIDRLGEQRAAAALTNVEEATHTATINLLVVLIGLALVGIGLAYLAVNTAYRIRRLYAEQQATAEQLARALSARNAFIADASHELRTPLTILRGNAEVGLEIDREGVHAPILEEIVRESARMSRLVEDLLVLARSDSDSLQLEIETISAHELLSGLVEPAATLARQHGAAIQTNLHGRGQLAIDRQRIEQAVLILVDNATKYGGSGGPITFASATRLNELVITVVDSGPGIPPADLPLIFERFYRVDKTRARKLGGSGLGLAIARSIVEAHGGRLEAESEVDLGTIMTMRLPLATTPA